MLERLHLKLITPGDTIFDDHCYSVTMPGSEGQFMVFSGHMDYLSTLGLGIIEISINESAQNHLYFYIKGGVVRVYDNICTVTVESALNKNNVDIKQIEQNLSNANELLSQDGLRVNHKLRLLKEVEYYQMILAL